MGFFYLIDIVFFYKELISKFSLQFNTLYSDLVYSAVAVMCWRSIEVGWSKIEKKKRESKNSKTSIMVFMSNLKL